MKGLQITQPCQPIISVLSGMKRNYGRYGGISALLAPSQKERYNDLDPQLECNSSRLQLNADGQPRVIYEYDRMEQVAEAANALSCDYGDKPKPALRGEYTLTHVKQMGVSLKAEDWTQFCCGAEEYFAKEYPGISADSTVNVALAQLGVSGHIKRAFGQRIDADLLAPIENDVITAISAGVGYNPAINSTGVQNIELINAQGQVTENLNIVIAQIQRKMNWCDGRYILLTGTGSKIANYANRCGISCCNSSQGLNPEAILQQSKGYFDWYTSTEIDILHGTDSAFLIAPNSATGHFKTAFPESRQGLVWAKTHYGRLFVEGSYCNAPGCIGQDSFTPMEFDLRVEELGCIDGFVKPALSARLSTQYGIWTAPKEFYYGYSALKDYTGIVQLKFI